MKNFGSITLCDIVFITMSYFLDFFTLTLLKKKKHLFFLLNEAVKKFPKHK